MRKNKLNFTQQELDFLSPHSPVIISQPLMGVLTLRLGTTDVESVWKLIFALINGDFLVRLRCLEIGRCTIRPAVKTLKSRCA